MSETIVRFKAPFTKTRATKATDAPTLAKGREAPENGTCIASMPPAATRRNVGRAARMLALAHLIERDLDAGRLKDFAAAAKVLGVSRARMSQVMALLNLSPTIQEQVLAGGHALRERLLRPALREAEREAQAKLLRP